MRLGVVLTCVAGLTFVALAQQPTIPAKTGDKPAI